MHFYRGAKLAAQNVMLKRKYNEVIGNVVSERQRK